jgi:hypothetical protein
LFALARASFLARSKNTGVILRSQTPLSYPSQKKTVQNDVTLIHSSNLRKKNAANFEIRSLYCEYPIRFAIKGATSFSCQGKSSLMGLF